MTAGIGREPAPRQPGAPLLHPLSLVALGVLLVNDHVLKAAYPSALTGKLSDLAGVFVLPLALQAVVGLAVLWRRGAPPEPALDNAIGVACAAATIVGFGLPEIWAPAEHAYRFGLGAIQWPYHAAAAWLEGGAIPGWRPVRATADVTDLVALPMALAALRLTWRTSAPARRRPASIAALSAIALSAWPAVSHAQASSDVDSDRTGERAPRRGERTHDGFYLDLELGAGGLFLDSDASISNGFQQPIAASARGVATPWLTLGVGGTLRSLSLVIGGRYSRAQTDTPVVRTLGQSFTVENLSLELSEVAVFGRYYPDAKGGLSFGGALGYLRLGTADSVEFEADPPVFGEEQEGVSLSAESAYTFWISRQFSAGGSLRLLFARVEGRQGESLLFAPALLGSLVWH